jgi:hypothetical protein
VRGRGRSRGASRAPLTRRVPRRPLPQGERRSERASPDAPLLDLAMRFSFFASKLSPPFPMPLHSPHLRPSLKGASLKRRLVTWGGVQKLPTVRTHVLSVRLGPATCWNAGCEERAETSVVCQKSCAGRSGGRTTKTNSSGSSAAPPPSRYCARARKKKETVIVSLECTVGCIDREVWSLVVCLDIAAQWIPGTPAFAGAGLPGMTCVGAAQRCSCFSADALSARSRPASALAAPAGARPAREANQVAAHSRPASARPERDQRKK